MLLNMNWKNFRSIYGEEGSRSKFESLIYDLLCYEKSSNRVYKTDSSRGGDGGIDIFVVRDGGVDIYQCKFFLDKMERTQWLDIKDSFNRAIKTAETEGDTILSWFLCTPFISNREPLASKNQWEKFVSENENRIAEKIDWLDGARIIQKLEKPELWELRVKYFTIGENVSRSVELAQEEGSPIFRGKVGDDGIQKPDSQLENDFDFQQAKSVRQLSEHIYINWKTHLLYDNRRNAAAVAKPADGTSAENIESDVYASECNAPIEQLVVRLTPTEQRLLSVLVQGEGAVVGWDELYQRGIVMQREMDEFRKTQDSKERINDLQQRIGNLQEGFFDRREPNEDNEHILEISDLWENDHIIDAESEIRDRVMKVVMELYAAAPVLWNIIKPAENGAGYYLCQSGTAIKNTDSGYFSRSKKVVQKDLEKLCPNKKGYSNTSVWLRRYYTETCDNFETRISNASRCSESEEEVFGSYKMVQVYANAYAKEDGSDETRAMLDYVEKWYYAIQSGNSRVHQLIPEEDDNRFGRVLILNGQPGDGKTTFCKKAVYAHCFEGWMNDVPQVLWISLNPNDSNREIVLGGKLNLSRAICIINNAGEDGRTYYYCNPMDLEEGALIIFDGYDELVSELLHIEDTS